MYRVVALWNKSVDPIRFIEKGEEPELALEGLSEAS
jgi:hypothetical protein